MPHARLRYLGSFLKGRLLSEGGTSSNWIYNFFMGRELNPRIGTFDLKCVRAFFVACVVLCGCMRACVWPRKLQKEQP
jgi:hypothetical protein